MIYHKQYEDIGITGKVYGLIYSEGSVKSRESRIPSLPEHILTYPKGFLSLDYVKTHWVLFEYSRREYIRTLDLGIQCEEIHRLANMIQSNPLDGLVYYWGDADVANSLIVNQLIHQDMDFYCLYRTDQKDVLRMYPVNKEGGCVEDGVST